MKLSPSTKTELLVLSGKGVRYAVLGHYGFSEYECDTFVAALASARAQLGAGHARTFVAIRIEAEVIGGIGDGTGTDRELARFEVYGDCVALVPPEQGGLSDEQKARALALPRPKKGLL